MTANRSMFRQHNAGPLRFALGSALATALSLGVPASAGSAHGFDAQGRIQAELARGNTDKAIALGEAAVAQTPRDAALRAVLGHAYLRAGRFESAAMALDDAVSLGDTSDRTTLSLALAQIACGQNRAALATLDRGQGSIPAVDLGLALALAGDTGRGVAVLTDAVRDGSGSVKLRQNLAYAYALDGRWADAQLAASFDLAPDQVQTRLQQWAQSMQVGGERDRIARLLNVPITADQGMPAGLALNEHAALPPPAAAPEVAAVKTDANGELPPVGTAAPAPVETHPVTGTAVQQAEAQTAPAPDVAVASAPAPVVASAPQVAVAGPVAAHTGPVMTSIPVVEQIAATPVASVSAPVAPVTPVAPAHRLSAVEHWTLPIDHPLKMAHHASKNAGHVVQFGAFFSAEGAQRAKLILTKRDPELRGHSFTITEALVNGRNYWRVVTSGFDTRSAAGACANVRRHGGACFAYAANHAPLGEALALANTHGAGLPALSHRR